MGSLLGRFEVQQLTLVASGYSREDFKAPALDRSVMGGKGFFTPESLAAEICKKGDDRGFRAAPRLLRQEYARLLLTHRSTLSRFPELRRLRRQPGFWRKLDQSLLAVRSTALHEDEARVLLQRLKDMRGLRPVQAELFELSSLWAQWLESQGYEDSISVFNKASQILSGQGLPPEMRYTGATLWQNEPSEAAEAAFIAELSRNLELVCATPASEGARPDAVSLEVESWHTIQDCAESLGDELVKYIDAGEDPRKLVVLIPDSDGSVRLALQRVLRDRGIAELDPRDPLELRGSEEVKRQFLTLELVASGFERLLLCDWLQQVACVSPGELARAQQLLSRAGSRRGFESALPALGEALVARLAELERISRQRLTLGKVAELQLLSVGSRPPLWIERFWKEFAEDLKLLGSENDRLPIALWMQRIRARLDQTAAPTPQIRPVCGVRVFRASQANPELKQARVWLLGLPGDWLTSGTVGDFYFTARERDLLGVEFAVRSPQSVNRARKVALESWLAGAETAKFLAADFGADGSENESLELLFRELALGDLTSVSSRSSRGAHPRFAASYSLVSEARDVRVELPPLDDARLTATELDQLSRCPFLGLVQARWKLAQLEEPDLDLWPTTNGNLLHAAVEKLIQTLARAPEEWAPGDAARLCSEAWRDAWSEAKSKGRLLGWVASPQLEVQIERKGAALLGAFLEEELAYRKRSETEVLATEDQARLEWETECDGKKVSIRGKADRIDQHQDGLFVIDYKSGRQDLRGADVREQGYRLQLPFYAIAAQHVFKKPVLGVQFIELTREARRSVGLFPKALNGKQAGALTQVRSNNPSLFDSDPGELWESMEERIRERVALFLGGHYSATPVMGEKECERCRARGVCGRERREWVEGTP